MNEEKLKQILPKDELSKFTKLVPQSQTPIWHYWKEFVTHYLREDKSTSTVLNVRNTLQFTIRHISIYSIEQCNTPEILREGLFKAKEDRGWKNGTLNNHRKNLNTYFLWLLDMEYIKENKIKKVRKCHEVQTENHTLSESEIKQLRTHLFTGRRNSQFERYRNALLFDMMILTGARPCEILNIQMRDIKDKSGTHTLLIRGKKQKGRIRYYNMPSSLIGLYKMFVMIRQNLGRDEANLFCSQSRRTGLTYKGISKLVPKLSRELGFKITCYGIRRFVATNLYLKRVPLEKIQQHLGHTRITTTLRYIEKSCHLTKDGTDEMGKLLG
ncbi:site-specific integrase [Candidatus Gracilibacteria bacterium]|nr:site-specific integrase [Candidatus Gracilibacteria bacterium]